jgi:hypothetical protein
MVNNNKTIWEKAGFGLTTLCAIHCAATPVIISLAPMLGAKFEQFHQYEFAFLIISLILAFVLLRKDFAIHRNPLPKILIATAFFIAIIGWRLLPELLVSLGVSVLVLLAYWVNWKHKAACNCEHVH